MLIMRCNLLLLIKIIVSQLNTMRSLKSFKVFRIHPDEVYHRAMTSGSCTFALT